MKTLRLFAALLVVALLTTPAFPQESSEVAALLAKARKGNGIAQYNLGLAYAEGKGVAADPVEAYVWLSLARENGARGRALDNLMGTLDKDSVEQAQRRLTERKAELGVRTSSPVNVRTTTAPVAKESAPAVKAPVPAETPAPAAPPTADSPAERATLAAEITALRAERERLIGISAGHEKAARAATEANQALQEQTRAAEAKAAELARSTDTMKGELARARLALTAAQKAAKPAAADNSASAELDATQKELERTKLALAASLAAPKPASDTAALDQKNRELQAALAELEASRTFGRQVEDTLNKVNDDKARVAAAAAAELAEARAFGSQVENTLNKVSDQKTALESSLRAAEAARDSYAKEYATANAQLAELKSARPAAPAAPAYPDLSGRVATLEAALTTTSTSLAQAQAALAAKPSAPAYPDLSGKVTELEAKVSSLTQSSEASLRNVSRELEVTKASLAKANDSLAAKPAAPAYPDLRPRVSELETRLASTEKSLADQSAEADHAKQEVAALTKARADKPAAPAYPDLRGNVTALEARVSALAAENSKSNLQAAQFATALEAQSAASKQSAAELAATKEQMAKVEAALAKANDSLAAKPAAPAYPDLSGRVAELESAYTAASTSLAHLSAEADRAKQEVAVLTKAKEEAQAALAAKPAAPAYPDLSGKVAELQAQLTHVSAEADRAKQDVAALTKAKAEAQAAAPAAPAYPNLSGKVTELETALASSTQKAATAEQARAEVVKQFDDYKSATAAAQRERTTLLASVKLLESDKASLRRQAESAGTEAAQLRTQVSTLKEQLAAKPVAATYPDLRGRVTDLETDLAAAKQAVAAKPAAPAYPDLSAKVAELETTLRDTTRQLATASTEADRAKREIAALSAAKAEPVAAAPAYPDYTNLVKDLTTEVTKLRTTRDQLQQALADSDRKTGELTASTSHVKELETQVSSLQAALKDQPAAVPAYPDLSGKVAELEAQLAKPVAPTVPAYPDLSGRVTELEAQLAQVKAAPAAPDLSGRVSELETALADSARKLTAADSAQAELRQQLAAVQEGSKTKGDTDAQLRRERDELSGRVTSLSSEVSQLRDDRERMQKMLGDAGRKLRDSTADAGRIKELETQASSLQASLNASQSQASELQAALSARPSAPSYPDLSGKVAELESALAAKPAAPAYPDLSNRVRELEAQVAAAPKSRTPSYPNLSGRVNELETTLANTRRELMIAENSLRAATAAPVATASAPAPEASDLEKRLAETEDKLKTALRGYALLEKDRDAQQARSGQAAEALTAEKSSLTTQVATLTAQVEQLQATVAAQAAAERTAATLTTEKDALSSRLADTESRAAAAQAEATRLGESLAALQRSTGQTAGDAASARALVQQLQGANTVLAQENYQLKTQLARTTGGPAPAAPVAALVSPPAARMHVVASGDSLSKISQRYYGTANRWQEIYNANAGKLGPNGILRVGTELRIP